MAGDAGCFFRLLAGETAFDIDADTISLSLAIDANTSYFRRSSRLLAGVNTRFRRMSAARQSPTSSAADAFRVTRFAMMRLLTHSARPSAAGARDGAARQLMILLHYYYTRRQPRRASLALRPPTLRQRGGYSRLFGIFGR